VRPRSTTPQGSSLEEEEQEEQEEEQEEEEEEEEQQQRRRPEDGAPCLWSPNRVSLPTTPHETHLWIAAPVDGQRDEASPN
jgi:hypothetical protein